MENERWKHSRLIYQYCFKMKKITVKLPEAGEIEIKVSPTDKTYEGKPLWKSSRNYYTVENGEAFVVRKITKEHNNTDSQLSEIITWSERFTRLRNHFSWTYKDISKLLDCSEGSLRKMVSSKTQNIGIGFRFAIIIFELCNGLSRENELFPPSLESDKNNPYFED